MVRFMLLFGINRKWELNSGQLVSSFWKCRLSIQPNIVQINADLHICSKNEKAGGVMLKLLHHWSGICGTTSGDQHLHVSPLFLRRKLADVASAFVWRAPVSWRFIRGSYSPSSLQNIHNPFYVPFPASTVICCAWQFPCVSFCMHL